MDMNDKQPSWLSPLLIATVFIAAGAFHVMVYAEMPIVRNSLIYAHIVQAIMEHGPDFSPAEHGYGKALGFSVLSIPFVKAWGYDTGLKWSSFVWTALWVLTMLVWWKRMTRSFSGPGGYGADRKILPGKDRTGAAFLIVAVLNPLVFYQFMSAYPDTLFAVSFLWGLYFLDRTLSMDIQWWDGVLLGFVTLFCIWVKHSGFILFPAIAAFAVFRRATVADLWRLKRRELLVAALALAGMMAVTAAAQAGLMEWFNFGGRKDNYLGGDERLSIVFMNLDSLRIYVLFAFSTLTPLLFYWRSFKRHKEWYVTLIIFVVSILIFEGTRHNIRYFLGVAPILAFIITINWQRLNVHWRRLLMGSFIVVNLYTLVYFNSIAFHSLAEGRFISPPIQDNFRLAREQIDRLESIRNINRLYDEGTGTLIFVRQYYGDAGWHIWEKDGYFRKGLRIIYTFYWDNDILEREGLDRAIVYDMMKSIKRRHKRPGVVFEPTEKVFIARRR